MQIISFLICRAAGKDDQVAPRTGFFHNFKQREVIVKKWDKQHEGGTTMFILIVVHTWPMYNITS